MNKNCELATFAGGCFWGMQKLFDQIDGVLDTTVGYTGGSVKSPSYEQVCHGNTGHAEAIQITFDPSVVTYECLLALFWKNIDPTTLNRQHYDVGTQYRTAVFYHDDTQKKIAEKSKEALMNAKQYKQIVTEIVPATTFFPAEVYHQKYYLKHPVC